MIERDLKNIDTIIIHCSDTPNGEHVTALDIDSWHKIRNFKRQSNAKKYHCTALQHIGYHFVVWLNGVVESGRAIREIGAHAKGLDARSIGICLIGKDQYTMQQWQSLRDCITGLRRDIPSINNVIGHNNVSQKSCPGFSVKEWLSNDKRPLNSHLLSTEESNHG